MKLSIFPRDWNVMRLLTSKWDAPLPLLQYLPSCLSSSIPPFSRLALTNGMRCILNLPGPMGIGIIALNRIVLVPDEKILFLSQREPVHHLSFSRSKVLGLEIDLKCMRYTACLPYTWGTCLLFQDSHRKSMQNWFLKLHFVMFKSVSMNIIILQFQRFFWKTLDSQYYYAIDVASFFKLGFSL